MNDIIFYNQVNNIRFDCKILDPKSGEVLVEKKDVKAYIPDVYEENCDKQVRVINIILSLSSPYDKILLLSGEYNF